MKKKTLERQLYLCFLILSPSLFVCLSVWFCLFACCCFLLLLLLFFVVVFCCFLLLFFVVVVVFVFATGSSDVGGMVYIYINDFTPQFSLFL